MAVSHVFSSPTADWTGTVTVGNSNGATMTVAATNLIRPVDWNSGHNQFYTLSGNTNNASTASGTNVVLAATQGITVLGSTGTIKFAGPVYKYFAPFEAGPQASVQLGQNSISICPATFPYVEHDRFVMPVLFSHATNSTGSATATFHLGLYTRSSNSISLLQSSSGSWAVTFSGTANSTLNSNSRIVSFGWTTTIEPREYYIGIVTRTTTGGANCTWSNFALTAANSTFSGYLGSAVSASVQIVPGLGFHSVTSTALPAVIAFSDIIGSVANRRPFVSFVSQSNI